MDGRVSKRVEPQACLDGIVDQLEATRNNIGPRVEPMSEERQRQQHGEADFLRGKKLLQNDFLDLKPRHNKASEDCEASSIFGREGESATPSNYAKLP